MSSEPGRYPGGARFAFTIVDDTDVSTRENTEPFYDLLLELGLRATKTVWPLSCPEGSPNFSLSETLEEPGYAGFVERLADQGFEITWHGATMESSRRERTIRGLEAFRSRFGHYPEIHINHAHNRENLYWGSARVDSPWLRALLDRNPGLRNGVFQGHVPGSEFWWGDLAERHIRYARNLTFNGINTLQYNPSMPYRDPSRPLVERWFSASDAEGVEEFNRLLAMENQERLEAEGGACIVATHVGKGFAQGGRVHPETRRLLEGLAAREGWFPTVGELLDWLARGNPSGRIPAGEWRRMQWRWATDLARRKWNTRVRTRRSRAGGEPGPAKHGS